MRRNRVRRITGNLAAAGSADNNGAPDVTL
jgi:hypothetical protein